MKDYSVLAKYYDRFSQNDCDYESWSQYLCAVAKKHNVKFVADVACGTGKMTELLFRQGFDVVGVDKSCEMLRQASQKCRARFVCQDMRRLALPQKADMVVVVNDGVNYLKQEELTFFFTTVAQSLKPHAPFVFDVSSPHKLQDVLGNNVFFVDDSDATLLWTNKAHKSFVELSLTLFEKRGESYVRFDEHHRQYVHTLPKIQASLAESGFEVREISADYGKKLKEDSLRITIYAVKAG